MTCSGSNSEEVEFQPSQTAAPLLPNIHYFYYSAIMLLNLLLLTIHYFGVHCRRVPATAAKLLWNAAIRLQQWLAGPQTANFSQQNLKKGVICAQVLEKLNLLTKLTLIEFLKEKSEGDSRLNQVGIDESKWCRIECGDNAMWQQGMHNAVGLSL